MTVAIVLGLLITGAVVGAGWYGYRTVFVVMPERHRLEVEYSVLSDEEKSAKAKLDATPKHTDASVLLPRSRLVLNLHDEAPSDPVAEERERRKQERDQESERKKYQDYADAEDRFEFATIATMASRHRFWDKYGRWPRYLEPGAR